MREHEECSSLYTDGAKRNTATGYAVWQHLIVAVVKLQDMCGIYAAELSAIQKAVQLACMSDDHDGVVIYTDSKSSIKEL